MSLASNRWRSFSSEVADETTRRNSFEDRLLQRKLDDIEKHAARQKKKITTEQLELAVENLSLEDVGKFNNLTRKILRSNYLPPLTPNRTNEAVRGDEDVRRNETRSVAERLRGTRMMGGSQSARSPRKLIRSFSDPSTFPRVDSNSKQENIVLDQRGPSCKVTFGKIRTTKRNSVSAVEQCGSGHEEPEKLSTKTRKSSTERKPLFYKLLPESDDETPSLGCKPAKPTDKTLKRSPRNKRNKQSDKLKHECLADAITYKLRMRETARKMMKVEITEPVKDTEDVFLSAYSKKWGSNV